MEPDVATKVESTTSGANKFEDDFNPVIADHTSTTHKTDINTKPCGDKNTSNCERMPTRVHNCNASPLVCYALRLKHGEELRKTLLNFVEKHELKGAFIMTCVGSALTAKIRLASAVPNTEGNYMIDLTNLHEIVSLQGTLSHGGHLHVALADFTGKVIGGHMIELVVDTTVEVVIGEATGLSFTREYDQTTGFNELVVNSR